MEISKKKSLISSLLFLIGNLLSNFVLWKTYLYFIDFFIVADIVYFLANCICVTALIFFKIILNCFVLYFSNFVDTVFKQKKLFMLVFLIDICYFIFAYSYIFNAGNEIRPYITSIFIICMITGNLFSILLVYLFRKIKTLESTGMKRICFILLFKLISLIAVFCFIFFVYFVVLLEIGIENGIIGLLSSLAIVPIVFFPIIIENYSLQYVYKNSNLIKRIGYRQIKNMLWSVCIEFIIFYICFLWINLNCVYLFLSPDFGY